jgi:uncharacterized membrane protein YeaQ/YmgE (transglycosylase-associated protein family)
MGILSWVIFGALAGWVASMLAGTNERQGCITNIVIGVVGAFIGGFVIELVTGSQFSFDFNIRSFIVAVVGAVGLLALTGWGQRRSRRNR